MKKIPITIILVLAALLIVAAVVFFLVFKSQPPTPSSSTSPSGSGTFPSGQTGSSSSPSSTMTITEADGTSIASRDFLHDTSVKPDPVNQGYYILGPQPAGDGGTQDLPYLIEYISQTNYFAISVQKEPLGDTRKAAEQYLMQELGISEEQMCALKYDVAVPDSVNTLYAGQSLGFSFCPGATKLP